MRKYSEEAMAPDYLSPNAIYMIADETWSAIEDALTGPHWEEVLDEGDPVHFVTQEEIDANLVDAQNKLGEWQGARQYEGRSAIVQSLTVAEEGMDTEILGSITRALDWMGHDRVKDILDDAVKRLG